METETQLAALPDDALAAILGRLPARSLAASRCVCKAWRGIVDVRRLLLPHVLPHSVRGLFINYHDHDRPHLFARPTSPSAPGRRLSFTIGSRKSWYSSYRVTDHCNGLVLHNHGHFNGNTMYVCNPATRWWARLPPWSDYGGRTFLVFDPAVSPHYEVLGTERDPENPKDKRKEKKLGQEEADAETTEEEEYNSWRLTQWPPSRWTWQWFSSRTSRQWEERVFVREGEAAGTLGDLLLHEMRYISEPRWRYAAYWQGALYVHCQGEYVSRLSLSNNTYQVIKSPIDLAKCDKFSKSFLEKSEKGVYFATIDDCQLQVWILNESCDRMEWVLMHHSSLKPYAWKTVDCYEKSKYHGPWILDDYNKKKMWMEWVLKKHSGFHQKKKHSGINNKKKILDHYSNKKMERRSSRKRDVEWDSDDDNIVDTADGDEGTPDAIRFLGFHPYKEVVFLSSQYRGVAYHLNTSKTQYLGMLRPSDWDQGVCESFVYTPCLIRH